ncbi:MAG: protein kinase domain-containing protein, partial [Planctomycetota bacterium]
MRSFDRWQSQDLTRQVLEILAYVHLRGILHLDIKPANLLRDEQSGSHLYRLLDFGLGSRKNDGSRGGSLFYSSPEQYLGVQPDARADLFSLGALIFSMLQESSPDIRRFIARFPRENFFTACDSRPENLPSPFDRILPRLVARQPSNRYLDAQEALEALAPGSGRPSLSALIPDPVATYGSLVEASISQLEPGEGLEIRGGSAEDRRAMALHGACILGDLQKIESGPEACNILRQSQSSVRICTLPLLDRPAISTHLHESLSLDRGGAEAAAELAIRKGATSPAA